MDASAAESLPEGLAGPAQGHDSQEPDASATAPEPYDFRTGSEMPREGVFQLRTRCGKFARVLGPIVSAYLDTTASAHTEALEASTLDRCLQRLGEFPVVGIVEVAEHLPDIIWHIDGVLTGAIIGHMLGGGTLEFGRSPTALESALLGRFIQEMMDVWAATWEGLAQWHPEVTEVVADLAQLQTRVRDEQVMWFRIATTIAEQQGAMNLLLPVNTVQRLLGSEQDDARAEADATSRLSLDKTASQVMVRVSVVVHQGSISLGQAMRLREGQVIPLRKPMDAPLTLAVRGRPKFLAQAGVRQGHLAARLLGPTEEFAP